MILNGIEITPESLKAQLEEQGLIVTEKPKPTQKRVWVLAIVDDPPTENHNYRAVSPCHTGTVIKAITETGYPRPTDPFKILPKDVIDDTLIQALESLYIELRGSDVVFKANDNGRLFDALKKVNDIKSRTAGK